MGNKNCALRVIITAFIIFLISCDSSTNPPVEQKAEIYQSTIQSIIEETTKEHNVPGSIALIRFDDGSIHKSAYGFADISEENKIEMHASHAFRIGSVTKTFIGTSILILVKQNKLQLSHTVEKLMPGLIKHGNEITLEMLLNQSSAIPEYTATDEFSDTYFYNPTYSWTHEEILSLYCDEDLVDTPGIISYYSNSNYYTLGLIIEKYSGKSLDQFLNEEIFVPLGMNDTYLPTGNEIHGSYAHGYLDVNYDGNFTEDEDYTVQSPYAIWAAGGIVSTVDDLLIWSDEIFEGNLLNAELQNKRMVIDTPIFGAPEGVNYGLAIADIFGSVGHNGAVAGYTTILFKYNNTTFIAFGNGYETTGDKGFIADDLFDKLKEVIN
ncbi:MAG: serine hydrolase domain-containing protein [Melioribacteraceae bacterium]|nr:serine hydrolase domain-containing protein [Melioribacteraceae bacterium]